MNHPLIASSVHEAPIDAGSDAIDLTDWVFTLTDAEYQACSKNHIACSSSRTAEGKRMSINVEHVGTLLIQHYVEDLSERKHCRLSSVSDSIGPSIDARVKLLVIWEFKIEPKDANRTRFTNKVEVRALEGYLDALRKRNVTFEQASQAAQAALEAHNAEETPLFAKDIERKARNKRWP